MRLSGQFQTCFFFFFYEKILNAQKCKSFKRTKTQIKPKSTNKTKISEQKTTMATIFRAQKLLREGKLFILRFLKKFEIVLITSFTTVLNYAVLTLPLSNYFYLFLSTHKTL